MPSLSPAILSILSPFAILFSRPVWKKALTLFIGAIVCRGKRTVYAALRVMDLNPEANFSNYHHVLNRVEWSLLSRAKILLNLIVAVVESANPLSYLLMRRLNEEKGQKLRLKATIGMPYAPQKR